MIRGKMVMDEHLVRREFYNPNNFEIQFTRMEDKVAYILESGINPGPKFLTLKPNDWLVVNHAYYVPRAANGAELFNVVTNFGDSIGKGNKKVSLPSLQ